MATDEKRLIEACGELLQQLLDKEICPDGYEFFAAYDIKNDIGLEGDNHMMFCRPLTFRPGMQDGDVILMKIVRPMREWVSKQALDGATGSVDTQMPVTRQSRRV